MALFCCRAQKEEMEPQAAPDEQQQASEVTASRIAPPRLPSGSSDKGKALTQLHLDVGQRDFHTTTCTTCGMVFTPGNADDERLHAAFHGKHARALRYHHAKADKTLMVDGSRGKVILLGTQGGGAKSKRVCPSTLPGALPAWRLLGVLTHTACPCRCRT